MDDHRSASLPVVDNSSDLGPVYNQSVSTSAPITFNFNMENSHYMPTYPELEHFSKEYTKYHGYIAAVVCLWGIVANLANIIILTRKNMRSSTNLILMWLAVADLLTMTSYFPVSIHFYIMKDPELYFPTSTSQGWIYFILFHINFTVVCHTVAIWLTICLAIFRYLYICYPTRGPQLCSIFRAKMAVLSVCLSTAIICIPNYLCTDMQENTKPPTVSPTGNSTANGSVYYSLKYSTISEPYIKTLNYWIHTLAFKLVPCVLLTILTILLIMTMHQAAKRRMKLKSQSKKAESERAREHNRTTGMLLAVVGLFLLTELPQGILTLCNIFIPDFYQDVYGPLGDLLDMAALLNNSINFVLYCTMSQQFRDTFVEVFCGYCSRHRPGWLKLKAFHVHTNGQSHITCTTDKTNVGNV